MESLSQIVYIQALAHAVGLIQYWTKKSDDDWRAAREDADELEVDSLTEDSDDSSDTSSDTSSGSQSQVSVGSHSSSCLCVVCFERKTNGIVSAISQACEDFFSNYCIDSWISERGGWVSD